MITSILLLSIITIIFSLRGIKKDPDNEFYFAIIGGGVFIFLLSCFTIITPITTIISSQNIAEETNIAKENMISIEHNLNNMIKNYNVQNPNAIIYVSEDETEGNGYYVRLVKTIPKLSSDAIVYQYTEDFEQNKAKLDELNNQSKKLSFAKWLLYFGK